MGLLGGGMTVRRFRVVGEPPEGWRDLFREKLAKMAFQEATTSQGKEEVEGWVRVQNLLYTDFDDFNTWLFGSFVVFGLRVDKKTLPARLLSATVELEGKKWAAERGVERVPAATKKEIKERIEAEWLDRALPRVAVTEVSWNVLEGWAVVSGHSDKVADRVRKRFNRTFNLDLVPWSPLDALADAAAREDMLSTVPTLAGGEG